MLYKRVAFAVVISQLTTDVHSAHWFVVVKPVIDFVDQMYTLRCGMSSAQPAAFLGTG